MMIVNVCRYSTKGLYKPLYCTYVRTVLMMSKKKIIIISTKHSMTIKVRLTHVSLSKSSFELSSSFAERSKHCCMCVPREAACPDLVESKRWSLLTLSLFPSFWLP